MTTPPADPESQKNFDEAVSFAEARLAQFEPREQVLDDLVNKFGIDYPQAESLMQYVENNDKTGIAARQFPMIAILGIASAAGGIALLAIYMTGFQHVWLLVTGAGLIMGGVVGVLEAVYGLVSGLLGRR